MTDLASLANPFTDNVVQHAWQAPADVTTIHDDVFRACLAGIESAKRGQPDSLLVYGPAGSGKTHLLTRLQRHLLTTAHQAEDHVLHCVFVFVRLQTSSQLLWQHVRRRFARDLMRRDEGLTQLQRLVAHQIAERTDTPSRSAVMRLRILGKEDHTVVTAHLNTLASELGLSRDLCTVLEHLLCNRGVRDAAAWLEGDSLPERILKQLDLCPDEIEDREEAAREVVTALARLAGQTLPIVFCFDQVEALQRSLDDREAFFQFGRLAADLHDADPNIFLITCLQSALLPVFESSIQEAHKDRMAKRHAILRGLTSPQVEALVRARLDSLPELATLRSEHPDEPLYPLSPPLVAQLGQISPCVPRHVLARAGRAFQEAQHGHVPHPLEPSEFLGAEWEDRARKVRAQQSPAYTSATLLGSVEVLAALGERPVSERDPEGAELVLGGAQKLALSLRNEADGRSLGPKLRQLAGHLQRKDGARWVIVRDPRLPIAKTAKKARETLSALTQAGVRLVEPTAEALNALAALASLLADAKSGDLANEGQTVASSEVLEWLRNSREDARLAPITELVDDLFRIDPMPLERSEEQDLAELLSRSRVLTLESAAQALAKSTDLVLETARRYDDHFLVLEGPPVVLLDRAGITAGVEA
jgi:hypothetical protein